MMVVEIMRASVINQRNFSSSPYSFQIQIRLNNTHTIGDWSEPLTVPRNASFTENCTLLPSPFTSASRGSPTLPGQISDMTGSPSEAAGVPFWTYIIIGVGGGLLAVVLCCVPLTIFLCRNQRRKKKWKDVLKVTMALSDLESSQDTSTIYVIQ